MVGAMQDKARLAILSSPLKIENDVCVDQNVRYQYIPEKGYNKMKLKIKNK